MGRRSEQKILCDYLEGLMANKAEVEKMARELGCSTRTAYRVLRKIEKENEAPVAFDYEANTPKGEWV